FIINHIRIDLIRIDHTGKVYADVVYDEVLPPSELFARVRQAYPDKTFRSLQASRDLHKNYVFRTFKRAKERGWTWTSGIAYYQAVYVNPYTGKVVGHVDKKRDWITLSRFLHQNLLLDSRIGTEIVGAAALIMVFLALSGLYLWWPKNRRMLRQRMQIKWKARFKRVNWDVHSVGGFYTWIFILFFAGTGLVWTYDWWNDSVYRMLGDDPEKVFERPESPAYDGYTPAAVLDLVFVDAKTRQPAWDNISLSVPNPERDKGTISVSLSYDHPDSWWDTRDRFSYHPESGALHHAFTHADKSTGEKWRNSNYAMHVGSIWGWPTKIIASLCALFFASLPVTGFLIWWGRKKKSKTVTRTRGTIPQKKLPLVPQNIQAYDGPSRKSN
ncbi:MAG: PepSY-associated TM helix domain-containing protein, partial [Bacteroidota bacterium]